jgi:peptide/nickel transport system ATP-binding protein
MTERRPILEVENLTVAYDIEGVKFQAVREVSFTLHRDQSLGLVGESGSGKTTVALAVVRYLSENGAITDGSIYFDGIDLVPLNQGGLRNIRGRRIAMVYQDPSSALNPSIRVGEQVAEVFRTHFGLPPKDARARVLEMFARVHLPDPDDAYNRYPHEFSGGQQQRIIIAMALAGNPDLLILDEPTTGLDTTVEAEILALFAELRRNVHAAILFISHDIDLIAQVCDRIGVLYAGQIVEIGPTAEVLSRPSHPYTRGLVSCAVPLGATKDHLRLVPIEGIPPSPGGDHRGCAFAPRCTFAQERCRSEVPPLTRVGEGVRSRCFFAEDVRAIGLPLRSARSASSGPPSNDDLLTIRNLGKSFRTTPRATHAVVDVSFAVARGQVLGLVGESGCGKTTIARMVAGLIVPTSGTIRLRDLNVTTPVHKRSQAVRRALQMVFQHPDSTLNPRHRVGRILERTVTKLAGAHGDDAVRRVADAVSAVRLNRRHLTAFPDALSGGEKQRVAIARAFISNPELVVCDEPTSSLDVSVQAAILNLLADLQKNYQASYVFISHDLAIVRYLADQIAVMYLGEIVEIGPADRVFQPPLHPYTEVLLSAARSLGQDRPAGRRVAGSVPSPADRPRGCPFHPRCPRKVGPECERVPPWQMAGEGHRYRCVIPPDELRRTQVSSL